MTVSCHSRIGCDVHKNKISKTDSFWNILNSLTRELKC